MGGNAISDFRVLIVPGVHDSGPTHWQTRWQKLYPAFERVEQAEWDKPQLDVWSERLDQVLRSSAQPTLIVAHSFGCLTTVHCIARGAPNVVGTLLVAPADPEKFCVAERLRTVNLTCPSIVIGSTNDPWMEASRAADWASNWGSKFVNAGALGHINADSGLADWTFGLMQLQRVIDRVKQSASTDIAGISQAYATRDGIFAYREAAYPTRIRHS